MNEMKTYKLFVGGSFVRSESGRVTPVLGPAGAVLARVATASRKDVRDAVTAARGAQAGWAAATPYLRGQILYRVAEMLDGRRAAASDELVRTGWAPDAAASEVDAAVETWVWWAGWADKLVQVLGSVNPVAGPFLNVSTPEPVGVVGVIALPERPLSGLAAVLAPVLCAGNTAVVLASAPHPLAALSFAEVLSTSDVPSGVANLLWGSVEELSPWLADHDDVDALDLSGAERAAVAELVARSAGNLKRTACTNGELRPQTAGEFLDVKTVWHPARL